VSVPQTVEGLNRLLADATVFYQKLRHYHWNVKGQDFFALHARFEALYDQWAAFIDEVAERILAMGGVPIHTLSEVLDTAALAEDDEIPSAQDMVRRIAADLGTLDRTSGVLVAAAEELGDRSTVNLLDGIRDVLEKDRWMLEAWLEQREPALV